MLALLILQTARWPRSSGPQEACGARQRMTPNCRRRWQWCAVCALVCNPRTLERSSEAPSSCYLFSRCRSERPALSNPCLPSQRVPSAQRRYLQRSRQRTVRVKQTRCHPFSPPPGCASTLPARFQRPQYVQSQGRDGHHPPGHPRGPGQAVAARRPRARPGRPQNHGLLQGLQRQDGRLQGAGQLLGRGGDRCSQHGSAVLSDRYW